MIHEYPGEYRRPEDLPNEPHISDPSGDNTEAPKQLAGRVGKSDLGVSDREPRVIVIAWGLRRVEHHDESRSRRRVRGSERLPG